MNARHLVAVSLAAAVLGPGGVAIAAPATVGRFQTPSRQVVCEYFAGSREGSPQLRCDLRFLKRRAVVVSTRGRAKLISVQTPVPSSKARVLAYGSTWKRKDFRCTVRRSGLTCTNTTTKHGFTVSQSKRKLF